MRGRSSREAFCDRDRRATDPDFIAHDAVLPVELGASVSLRVQSGVDAVSRQGATRKVRARVVDPGASAANVLASGGGLDFSGDASVRPGRCQPRRFVSQVQAGSRIERVSRRRCRPGTALRRLPDVPPVGGRALRRSTSPWGGPAERLYGQLPCVSDNCRPLANILPARSLPDVPPSILIRRGPRVGTMGSPIEPLTHR